ncbi:hypothetical protein GCM10023324_21520 [Streptomyces youssoufiensis]
MRRRRGVAVREIRPKGLLMTATDPAMTALAHRWSALSLPHGRIEGRVERALQTGHGFTS